MEDARGSRRARQGKIEYAQQLPAHIVPAAEGDNAVRSVVYNAPLKALPAIVPCIQRGAGGIEPV